MFTVLLDYILKLYIVLILYENKIINSEPFGSLVDAEAKAISLSNEWYREDGIKSFGLSRIRTIDDMRDYYGSHEYHNSSDSANICIEHIKLEDSLL